MEIFEIHITGDESIHNIAKKYNHKTIAIDLLRPDLSTIRVEHMTSLILKSKRYNDCKSIVDNIVFNYKNDGLNISRVKIESPFYDHYVNESIYIESHFETESTYYPVSRNQKKIVLLATNREYDKNCYLSFKENYKNKELELCLYDSDPQEDIDWLKLFEGFRK